MTEYRGASVRLVFACPRIRFCLHAYPGHLMVAQRRSSHYRSACLARRGDHARFGERRVGRRGDQAAAGARGATHRDRRGDGPRRRHAGSPIRAAAVVSRGCGATIRPARQRPADGANVLTHCNTGALATGGIGTALAPIYLAHEQGRRVHVYVDETRPLLQGSRLTTWELQHAGIPCTLITDGAAAALMRQTKVDVVLVGADRICANGDFANKIGTYGLAVLARHHGVPFYCAAPWSTVDASLADGDLIPIEQRAAAEVTVMAGRPIAPDGVAALNPAFDVTPARYVSGFVTDRGIVQPPFSPT